MTQEILHPELYCSGHCSASEGCRRSGAIACVHRSETSVPLIPSLRRDDTAVLEQVLWRAKNGLNHRWQREKRRENVERASRKTPGGNGRTVMPLATCAAELLSLARMRLHVLERSSRCCYQPRWSFISPVSRRNHCPCSYIKPACRSWSWLPLPARSSGAAAARIVITPLPLQGIVCCGTDAQWRVAIACLAHALE